MAEPGFWRFMRKAMLLPGVLLAFAVMFYGIAAGIKASDDALRASPVAGVAQVLALERIEPSSSSGRPSFRVALQVPDEGGGFRDELSIPENVWRQLRGAETVAIWQQADNPRNLRLAAAFSLDPPAIDPRWIGAGPLAVALLVMGGIIHARLPAWRALSGGDRATAIVEGHQTFRGRGRGGRVSGPAIRATWTGRIGRPQAREWRGANRHPPPPLGSEIEVAIDPETGREFRLSELG